MVIKRKPKPKFLVVDGCPCPYEVAAQVSRVLKRAGLPAVSIGRGDTPEERVILNAHGKHTQAQLSNASLGQRSAWGVTGTPNRPGHSGHERFYDDGRPQPMWMQAVDCGPNTDETRRRIHAAATFYGWKVVFPYDSVVEYHHWHFVEMPESKNRVQAAHLILERARLPRR